MKKERESWILAVLLLLLLPYLITVVVLGRRACPVNREQTVEDYVAGVAASQISWEYSKETIKAQVVLARTNLSVKSEKERKEILEETAAFFKGQPMNLEMLEKFHVFQEAARETSGEVLLTAQGEIKEAPYHALSSGKTRDGADVMGESYGYITSVETAKDRDSPLDVEGCYFSFQELEKKMKKFYGGFTFGETKVVEVKQTDEAGYVLELQIGNQMMQGEKIREILQLPSSCFSVQCTEEKVRFLCKGKGHGVGLSQYGAEQMAIEGKEYKEILTYFFPELQISEKK